MLPTASRFVRVSTTSSPSVASGPSLKSVLGDDAVICGFSTRTGSTRMESTNITRSSLLIPLTRPYVFFSILFFSRLIEAVQIRKDARINWIARPEHKRREARGLTSIGKQVGSHIIAKHSVVMLIIFPHRTVVWARATATITVPAGPPGKNTTLSACVATGEAVLYYARVSTHSFSQSCVLMLCMDTIHVCIH